MFQSATQKLTAMYLVIILLISFFFSIIVYQISSREIEAGLVRQEEVLRSVPRYRMMLNDPDVIHERSLRIIEGRTRIIGNLIVLNIIIAAAGGVGSYLLARRTLLPIQEAHEAQVRFTADASHELRTPLATMQTEIEVALRDPKLTLSQSHELLKSNLEELANLQSLSESLLYLAQGKNDQRDFSTLEVSDLLSKAIKRVKSLAHQKGVVVQSAPKVAAKVRGVESQLIELVVILLDNAIKYSHAGATVNLSAKVYKKTVDIIVGDQGIGIAKADITHIFDRFYRVNTHRSKTQVSGHGLGLAIAQEISEVHGGYIKVMSQFGKGSTFTVSLPRHS
ncbi:HAMP domain-containing histidine kinase [Candidatus Saccharibacteria bacterium]|nr:HAMP domain-containing histidine kinase [Candidatus Saccharibacteria bacterium]